MGIFSDPRAYSKITALPRDICGNPVPSGTREIICKQDYPRSMTEFHCNDSAGNTLEIIYVSGEMTVESGGAGPMKILAGPTTRTSTSSSSMVPGLATVPAYTPVPAKRSPSAPVYRTRRALARLTPTEQVVNDYYRDNFITFVHFNPKEDTFDHVILIHKDAITDEQQDSVSIPLYTDNYKRYQPGPGTLANNHPFDEHTPYIHILQGKTRLDIIMKADLDDFMSSLGV